MPPIRTFNSAPINPNSAADGSTSSDTDASQAQQDNSTPAPTLTASTTTTAAPSLYPPAKPGAAAPAPTAPPSTSSSATTAPPAGGFTPTRTYPAAPQPVSRPLPPGSAPVTPNKPFAVPPPPKSGEKLQPASYYARQPTTQPTATRTGMGMTPATPNSTSTPYFSTYQPPGTNISNPTTGAAGRGLTYNESNGEESIFGESGANILGTAKSWMASAGTKLAEAEAEVWKIVNSKS
ncbi:hypothetical protein BGW36DRAFT_385390 [Talaromyces proteolyticus]|uniref:Uncharacterized protein n=1 Tax=Talaromyces proteolyticus TaxID=1131652 RepID=A0AAD4KI96_9EURO|nr:uncharacterized protein BGW36DRAFT_385390 [Talaromyces proteolyticus]KAH8692873.1 hypothetical protein BGW36DRAFT_385390 [Talaromyces proteolyticus]